MSYEFKGKSDLLGVKERKLETAYTEPEKYRKTDI